jgi:hypothetical protein
MSKQTTFTEEDFYELVGLVSEHLDLDNEVNRHSEATKVARDDNGLMHK